MKTLSKFLFITIVILIIFISLRFLFNDTKNISFKNLAEASSYIGNGWIPNNLPENSKNIYVTYNIDTNIINGEFELNNTTEIENFKNSLLEIQNFNINKLYFLNNNLKDKISKILSKNLNNIFQYENFIFILDNNKIYFFSNH